MYNLNMTFKNLSLKKKLLVIVSAALILFVIFFFSRTPSNNRDWAVDQSILPYAVFNDNTVDIFNIRNFTYQSDTSYEPGYYDHTYNLDELQSVDYIVEPFGNPGAAHTMLSFGFKNGDYLSISVEIRKEKGESFSPFKGIIRDYEIMYVIADEKDAVKLRSNYRKDKVYVYPVETTPEKMRELFVDMLNRANGLVDTPEFYNTLTNTCTTNIAKHINNISENRVPRDLRLLLPENSDALAYELGLIDNSIPLEELREKHLINDRAMEHADSPNFSEMIRKY